MSVCMGMTEWCMDTWKMGHLWWRYWGKYQCHVCIGGRERSQLKISFLLCIYLSLHSTLFTFLSPTSLHPNFIYHQNLGFTVTAPLTRNQNIHCFAPISSFSWISCNFQVHFFTCSYFCLIFCDFTQFFIPWNVMILCFLCFCCHVWKKKVDENELRASESFNWAFLVIKNVENFIWLLPEWICLKFVELPCEIYFYF